MTETRSPVSHKVQVSHLPKKGVRLHVEATERQRAELAKNHGLLSVEAFSTELLVAPWRGDGVKVTGTLSADVTQQCVVTLEPVPARVETEVEGIFVPEGSKLARIPDGEHGEIVVHADSPDIPETFAGNAIDAGALAEEFFELALDPYPRKPGVAFDQPGGEDIERTSPFAGLSALKGGQDSGE